MIATSAARACALAAVLLIAAAPAGGQSVPLETFEGRYAFAGGQAERERFNAAIDAVADRLNFFIREIARGEIRRSLQPEATIELIVIDDERVRLTLGEWGPFEVRVDGRARTVRGPDGSRTELSVAFRNGRIETHQESARGHRHNWLSLSPDAEHLFLQSRVGAPQLPEAIRYTLTYRRVR